MITDHKPPTTTVLGSKTVGPTTVAARSQHWAVTLSAHEYDIVCQKLADPANCNFLSHLPVQSTGENKGSECVPFIEEIPVNNRCPKTPSSQ